MIIHYVFQNPVKVWVMVGSQCELRRVLILQAYMSTTHRTITKFVLHQGPRVAPYFCWIQTIIGEQSRSRSCLVLTTYGIMETHVQGKLALQAGGSTY